MKRFTTWSGLRLSAVLAALLWCSAGPSLYANGTTAGTAITNKATVNFNAGSNPRTATSATVTLHIGHKVTASFSPSSGSSNGVDDKTIYVPLTFTQNGNRWDQFAIAVSKSGSNTAKYTVDVMNDANGNGSFDAGEVVITNTGGMAADAARKMLLRIQVASETPDNDACGITVTMTSQAADAGTDTVVVNKNAAFTYTYTYTVKKPVIAFSVTQVTNTTANAARIPGKQITYRVSAQNTGSVAPTAASQVYWQYNSSLMTYASTTGSAAADSSGWKVFTLTAAQLPASMASPVTFDVTYTIDQTQNSNTGVTEGTSIYMNDPANSARVYLKYLQEASNTKWYNAAGGTLNFTVGKASGLTWTATPVNNSGNPGDVVEYKFTIKNTGNHQDTYSLADARNLGDLDVAHVFAMTAAGTAVTVTTAVNAGATQDLFVRVTVPAAATDGQKIQRNITVTTATATPDAPVGGSTSAAYTAPLVTTVKAPVLNVSLANTIASGVGTPANPAPGDVVQWTVTIQNAGTGNATSISSSNLGFAHTGSNTFVASSIDVDPAGDNSWTVTGKDNGGSFTGGTITVSSGIVTVTFTSIPSGSTVKYRYKTLVQ